MRLSAMHNNATIEFLKKCDFDVEIRDGVKTATWDTLPNFKDFLKSKPADDSDPFATVGDEYIDISEDRAALVVNIYQYRGDINDVRAMAGETRHNIDRIDYYYHVDRTEDWLNPVLGTNVSYIYSRMTGQCKTYNKVGIAIAHRVLGLI